MRRTVRLGWMVCLLCLFVIAPPAALAADEEQGGQPKAKAAEAKPSKRPASEKAEPAKKPTVVRFAIKGAFPEGPTSPGLFGDLQQSLATMIRRIDQAAEDDEVAAVWLRIEGLSLGRGKLHELRSAIARLRKAGKPVYAELADAGTAEYLVAAACDEIVMTPTGTLIVPGVRAEVTYYKGLFDKVGLQFDMLQMGKYKGAAEPYTRSDMSPPLRESLEAMVDDWYEGMATTIAEDRQMKDYQVKTLLDVGLFTAAAAERAGLIDRVLYADRFQESLCKQLGADELDLVTDYKKKKVDTDFSGLTGMMKLMELFMGGKRTAAASKAKKIAVVYAVGPIMQGKSASDIFGAAAVGSTTMVKALRKAADDPDVVAIVFRIDSPGGSALASDLIWRETVRITKPIIASMGDVAGSGGYYIAMGADKILAEPGTITGSIGVVGGKIVLGGLYDKIGLATEVISRGKNSGIFSSNEPFTPDERKAMMTLFQEIYRQFVRKAAQGRNLDYKQLERLAQGRIYTGRMAKANGLIDELGTLRDAIAEAKKAAGLKPDEKVELMVLPRPKTLFEILFDDPSASTRLTSPDRTSTTLESMAPELLEHLRQTALLRRLLAEPALLWMPYGLKVR